jgi:hypothetical protein
MAASGLGMEGVRWLMPTAIKNDRWHESFFGAPPSLPPLGTRRAMPGAGLPAPPPLSRPIQRTSNKWPIDLQTYKERNLIEWMFGRLKDFRRIATRYDQPA